MRLPVLAAATLVALLVAAAPASAGRAITDPPDCPGQYTAYGQQTRTEFREALLCVLNHARREMGLPALARSAPLERIAQSHAADEAKRRYANHNSPGGSTIASRFARARYRAAAYNEALGLGAEGATPYDLVRDLVDGRSHPCSAVFDPRFRDIGVGVDVGRPPGPRLPAGIRASYLVIDFGRRAGRSAPSRNGRPAASCPHRLPAPPFSGTPVVPTGAPVTGSDNVTITLRCESTVACAFSATMQLRTAAVTSGPVEAQIPARGTQAVRFPFDPAAIDRELAASQPSASLSLDITEPATLKDRFEGPLPPRQGA